MNDRTERARAVAEEIRGAGNYRWVGLYDVTPELVSLIAFAGPNAPAYPAFPVDRGLTAVAIRRREPVICNDVAADPDYLTALESTGSEMIVPVTGGDDDIIGTIDIESERLDAFGERDRRLIEDRMDTVRSTVFSRSVKP